MKERGNTTLLILGGLVVLGMFLLMIFAPWTIIGAGKVGVIVRMGDVKPPYLPSGFHILNPLDSVHKIDVQVQKSTNAYSAASKDLQAVQVEMTLNYRILPEFAPELFKNVGDDYLANLVLPAASESLKAEMALHNATEILEHRSEIKKTVHDNIKAWPALLKYGIMVDEVSLSNISFSKEYENAIEKKQLQEQATKQKEYELQQTKLAADMVIAKARGDSEAKKLEADGIAYFNEKTASSMTEKLLAARYYDKWDGKLPQYILGAGTNIMMKMPEITK